MNILVLGGTRFVGRAIVAAALGRGHDLTLFNRGSGGDLFPSARAIKGDRHRSEDLAQLADGDWDVVVDVSGYGPGEIRSVLAALGSRRPHHVFLSTISVYAAPVPIGAGEAAPLLRVAEDVAQDDNARAYGGLKVLCEEELRRRVGDRLTIIRPTVVIGPHDYTDRFAWWVRRIAAGGRVPVPSRLEQPVQLIDAEDLAAFVVRTLERGIFGTFNAVGPREPLTLGGMLAVLSATFDGHGDPVAAGDDTATIPLTLEGDGSEDGRFSVSAASALAQGLELRPLADSARAVLRWIGGSG